MSRASLRSAVAVVCAVLLFVWGHEASAYISQVDGVIVPQSNRMQACLDRANTGEGVAGAVNALVDAAVLPEAYRPVENPVGSGQYPVTFRMIGEGAGYTNLFGYYWVDEDISDPTHLHMVFDCRTGATCSCPCDPTAMRSSDGSTTSWNRTINFATVPGFAPGRALGFWIRTPERSSGGNNNSHCGGPAAGNQDHLTYFTSKALNEDGDYIHFLVYRSVTFANTFYFGFEDLFRGGDNDFDDLLARVDGLVPLCDPQPETCNNVDDDCDLVVDDGITQACSTACGAGTRTCSAGSFGACSAPTPAGESCNNGDDDCDGRTDEGLSRGCSSICGPGTEVCVSGNYVGCSARTPTIESCNNVDDDCDGNADESIQRACSTACGSGVETCSAGSFQGCTAPMPSSETCNGIDDNCNGFTDEGMTRSCMSACGSGIETCISGNFTNCTAPSGDVEACNNLDDDCDGQVDDNLTRTCSTSCGTGIETCAAGVWGGCDAPTAMAETCNNLDDNCNGVIDDGNPGGGAPCIPAADGGFAVTDGGLIAVDGGAFCSSGRVTCLAGELRCLGSSSPTRELCNCLDDDCDGQTDENSGGSLCEEGACVDCKCLSPCSGTEFACPPGLACDKSLGEPGYCVPGLCKNIECSDQEVCDPTTGLCQNLCADVVCGDGFACVRGGCVEDNCYGRGCPPGQRCRNAVCEVDPCLNVVCGNNQFCRDGDCIDACESACPTGTECQNGACVAIPCSGRCTSGETCINNECFSNRCTPTCLRGRICKGGSCIDDPCIDIECPAGTTCSEGECLGTKVVPAPKRGIATGRGGGFVCSVIGEPGTQSARVPVSLWMLLGATLVLVAARRLRAKRHTAIALLMGVTLSGCKVDPFCFDNCEQPDEAGDGGMTSRDGGPFVMRDAMTVDGCVPEGDEVCNDRDDDCDGVIDNGFDKGSDSKNCGGCGNECVLPHAFPMCVGGECSAQQCEIGWHDLNHTPADGCEYSCQSTGDEICDGRDNNCNGGIDEGLDLTSNLAHCGQCGNVCAFANAGASCIDSGCVMGTCNPGFVDLNGLPGDGCELRCTPTGPEMCNQVDDNCNGFIDEGFDLSTNVSHCGVCGRACVFPNSILECADGICGLQGCLPGFIDLDNNPVTGCEYPCTPTGGADVCNRTDDDCDGAIDEADPAAGSACGATTGACELGVTACQLGSLTCVGARGPVPETCNNIDDDCDGTTDESTVASPIPGIGVRCGSSNVGQCRYGAVVCTAGALTCGGGVVEPGTELCNGVDDNCNGAVDDSPTAPGTTPSSCTQTLGVCASRTPSCTGAGGWQCSFPITFQATETICEATPLDNDCDGTANEGCLTRAPASDVRVDLGDAVGAANSLSVALSGDGANRVYASWMDLRGGGTHILFGISSDGGTTWGATPTQLDSGSGAAISPRFGVTGATRDTIATVWADFRGGSYRQIRRNRSTNFGSSWGTDTRINSGQDLDSFSVDVAVSGTNVYATWETFTTSRSRHIFFSRSTAGGGGTWSTVAQVDHGAGTTFVAAAPKIAAVGNNVYVVWRDNRSGALDIYFSRSADSGVTFSASDTRLDVGTTAGSSASFTPVIAAEGSNVYAAWVDERGSTGAFDIWLNRSADSGATWLTPDPLRLDNETLGHDSIEPRLIAPKAGVVIAAWIDYRYGFSDVLVSRSVNSGATFSSPVRADTGTAAGASGSFDMALDGQGDLIALAWADERAGFLDIFTNFSLDAGANWQPTDLRMDSTAVAGSSDSERPVIYVAPNNRVHVAWADHRNGANGDIYYRRLQ